MLSRTLLLAFLLVAGYFFIRRFRRSSWNQHCLRLPARLNRWLSTVTLPGRMSRSEAYAILGLPIGANQDEIQAAYRRLIQRLHPDQGGSAYLAACLNRARDVLLG